ncbi:right-handed parallel beta-helix repeat-containing protein [Candidatus Woesearchaeota archaeon]|nr:right-handed parallel beta-helix repeat-containing protein [Candidatus Woesearchaeota archaeon]
MNNTIKIWIIGMFLLVIPLVAAEPGYVDFNYSRVLVHVNETFYNNNTADLDYFLAKFEERFNYMEDLTGWSHDEIYGTKMEVYLQPTIGCYGGAVQDMGTYRKVTVNIHDPYDYAPCKVTYRDNNVSKFGNSGDMGDYWKYMSTMLHESMHGIFPEPVWDRKWLNEGFAVYLEHKISEDFGDINRETTEYNIHAGTSYYNWDGYAANDYHDTSPANLTIQSSPGYSITAQMLVNLENTYGTSMMDDFFRLYDNNLETLYYVEPDSYIDNGWHRNDKTDTFMIHMFSLAAGTNLTPTFRYDGPSGPGWGVRNFTSLDFMPDLYVYSLIFSNSSPNTSEIVTAYITVNNSALFEVETNVSLYSDSVAKGSKDVTVPSQGSVQVEFNFTEALAGTYDITAWADKQDVKAELDETNNDITEQINFIGEMNSAPELLSNIPDKTWDEDTEITVNLSMYFSDPDNDTLNYTSTSPSDITVSIDQATSIATLTPDPEWGGVDSVIFTASDLYYNTNSNNITLTVNPVINEVCDSCSSCTAKASIAGNYIELTQDITTATDCVNITADNITLDCNGHSITGDGWTNKDPKDYGVYVKNANYVTVQNCNLFNLTKGIYASVSDNSIFQNNNIKYTYLDGIGLESTDYNKVLNNTFNYTSDVVYMESADYTAVKGNKIYHIDAQPSTSSGLTVSIASDFNNITENEFHSASTPYGDVVYVSNNVNSNRFWLNHFYYLPATDDDDNTQWCVNGEGNFYADGVAVTAGDCGQADIIQPNGGENISGVYEIQWSPQSSYKTIEYAVYYSNNSGSAWNYIDSTSGTEYSWNTSTVPVGTNFRIKIIPSDGLASAAEEISDGDFSIIACIDSDSDGVCDSFDLCIGESQSNLPSDTECATYSFNSTNGCHIADYNATGTMVNSYSCDSFDTVCADYNTVYDTCDGAGNIINGNCGDNITYQPNGFVVNQTDCGSLSTTCRVYDNVNNTCDGAGGINFGSCTLYTDEPVTTQCGTETCPADTCVGEQWYDYPASDTKYCDGSGSCGSASCIPTISYSASCDHDLSADELYISRTKNITAGGKAVARFRITNNGANTEYNVKYTVDTGSSDSNPIGNIASIAPDQTITGYINWIYSTAGSYIARLIVDYDNSIEESDETNNEKQANINVG